jgi:hypothetical protein
MKPTIRMILLLMLCLALSQVVPAQKRRGQPTIKVAGVYDNVTVGQGSGDLEGMQVILIEGRGEYYAVVQIASGGAELPAPVLVKANVKGANIDFTVSEPEGQGSQPKKFTGSVTNAGLRLRNSGGESSFLKRNKCSL